MRNLRWKKGEEKCKEPPFIRFFYAVFQSLIIKDPSHETYIWNLRSKFIPWLKNELKIHPKSAWPNAHNTWNTLLLVNIKYSLLCETGPSNFYAINIWVARQARNTSVLRSKTLLSGKYSYIYFQKLPTLPPPHGPGQNFWPPARNGGKMKRRVIF